MQVLIAEDELATRKMLCFVFEQQAGHRVVEAESGGEALRILGEQPFDLLLTDLTLPDMDGLELVRRVRRTSSIPIMIISARVDIPDRVRGLKSGADDYIGKPFDVSELLARVDALMWRARHTPKIDDGRLAVGKLVLMPQAQAAEVEGKGRVRLTPTELRLLLHLAKAPGQVRSRRELDQLIAGEAPEPIPGALNTYISNLRHKLETNPHEPRLIQTVRSQGYRLAV